MISFFGIVSSGIPNLMQFLVSFWVKKKLKMFKFSNLLALCIIFSIAFSQSKSQSTNSCELLSAFHRSRLSSYINNFLHFSSIVLIATCTRSMQSLHNQILLWQGSLPAVRLWWLLRKWQQFSNVSRLLSSVWT